jgi:hypothetical protein
VRGALKMNFSQHTAREQVFNQKFWIVCRPSCIVTIKQRLAEEQNSVSGTMSIYNIHFFPRCTRCMQKWASLVGIKSESELKWVESWKIGCARIREIRNAICIERLHDDCGLIRARRSAAKARISLRASISLDRMQKLLFAAHLADLHLFACVRSVWKRNKNRWCFHARHRGEMLHICIFLETRKAQTHHARCAERGCFPRSRAHVLQHTRTHTDRLRFYSFLRRYRTPWCCCFRVTPPTLHTPESLSAVQCVWSKIPQKQQFLMHFLLAFWITVFTNISVSPHEFLSYLSSIVYNGPFLICINNFLIWYIRKHILTFTAK